MKISPRTRAKFGKSVALEGAKEVASARLQSVRDAVFKGRMTRASRKRRDYKTDVENILVDRFGVTYEDIVMGVLEDAHPNILKAIDADVRALVKERTILLENNVYSWTGMHHKGPVREMIRRTLRKWGEWCSLRELFQALEYADANEKFVHLLSDIPDDEVALKSHLEWMVKDGQVERKSDPDDTEPFYRLPLKKRSK